MRLAVFDDWRIGVVSGGGVSDITEALPGWSPRLGPSAVNELIARFDELRPDIQRRVAAQTPRPLGQVRLRAPVPRPTHLFAAPRNFREHQNEMHGPLSGGGGSAADLGFFLKATGAISGPSDAIEVPSGTGRRFDYEGEVAFVIGKEARGVSREHALEYVFGYTIVIDATLRMTETQREERTMRKSFATFAPMGPFVVTADEIPDPSSLRLQLWRNGAMAQDACLKDLIVDIPGLIEQASAILPLQPGDVYATGSPAGVGQIQPGDELIVEVEQIGRMVLPVRARAW
ncbi:MAG: fumarylacetoacetate hydrolase family protein [Chloroflexi bacterium]|nr:fumarylacetoacetate hydrolase family protein [Chloroflexota bacterium]